MDLRFLLVLCLAAATQADYSIVSSGKCLTHQCTETDLLRYEPGKSYVYKYYLNTDVFDIAVTINGNAIITKNSGCEFSIKLADVKVQGVPDGSALADILEAKSARFVNTDGLISEICHDLHEDPWVLNIKRAIVSSLQIATKSTDGGVRTTHERDLMGDCEARYEQIEENYKEITLKKTKNLKKCRNHFTNSLANTWESLVGFGKNMQYCTYKITTKNSIIQSVTCEQVTSSNYKHVSQLNMKFIEERAAPSDYQQDITGYQRSSLLFVPQPPKQVDQLELKQMLETLCSSTEDLIKPEAPLNFRKFVQALDVTKYEHLKSLWQTIEQQAIKCDSQRGKKLFIQAVTYSRSGAALKLAHNELYKRNIISEDRLKAMVHSLIFKDHITPETVEALVALLQSNLIMKQSLFGLTSAIQKYVDAGYDRSSALVAVKLIANQIGSDTKYATIIVRALGNVQVWDDEIIERLVKLAKSTDPELAIAAIDTLGKNHPCSKVHELLDTIITTRSYPVEVRVAALKSYAKCAKAEDLTRLVKQISSSTDKNFYGYVQTFLYHKYQTMDPDYQALRIEIDRAESIDFKPEQFYHSRHWAFNKMTPNGLTGINIEADIVVENSKKIPTWFIFNASIPIYRHNVHGFEIGVRQEGLDDVSMKLMEKIRRTNWQNAMDEIKKQQNFQPLANEISKIQQEFVTKFQRNGKLSVYLEFNQQTLFYFNGFQSENRKVARNPIISLLENAKGFNTIAAFSFSNYEASNPLMTGLEIHYWHVGSVIAGLKLQNQDSNKRGLYPNIAGDYVMARDLVLREPISGMVHNLALSSNAFLRYAVAFEQRKFFKLDLEFPVEEMDLLRVQDQHYRFKQNGQIIYDPVHAVEHIHCTLTESLGVQMCLENHMVRDKTSVWRIYLRKSDPSMTSLSAQLKRENNNEIVFNFDTPGSSVPHNVEMRFKSIFSQKETELRASFKCAKHEILTEARLERSANKIVIPVAVTVNKKSHSLRLEVMNDKPVTAKLRIVSPKLRNPIDYDAQISRMNLKAEEKFVKIFSNTQNGKRTQVLMVRLQPENWRSFNDFKGLIEVEANCPKAGNLLTMTTAIARSQEYPAKIEGKVSYQREGKQQQGSFSTAIRDLSTRDLKSYRLNGEIECSQWKQKGAKFSHELMLNSEKISNKLELSYGENYKTTDDVLIHTIFHKVRSGDKLDLKGTVEAKYNSKNFHHKAEIAYGNNNVNNVLSDSLKVRHENVKNSQQNHEGSIERLVRPSDVELNGKWTCPRAEKSFNIKLDRSEPKVYKTSAQYKNSKINSSPIYEANGRLNLAPISTEFEIVKLGSSLVKVQAGYENKRPTDIKLNAQMEYKGRPFVKVSAIRKDSKLEASFEEEVNRNAFNLNAEINRQAVFDYKQNKQPVYELLVKKSPSSSGNLYEIKSLTKRGVKRVPDILCEIEPKKFGYDLEVKGEYYTLTSKSLITKSAPKANFMVSFDCRKHRNVHKTEFNMDNSKIVMNSKHAKSGEIIYELRMAHERNNEGRSNSLELKAKNAFEINAAHVYNPREMKLNVTMTGKRDLDLSISSIKNAPVRGARHVEEPRVTKVRVIYKSKVGEGSVFKTYGEYKSLPKALRLTSVEYIRGGQREFLGSTNIATDSPLYARITSKSNTFDLEVDPWSPRKEIKYEYKTGSNQGSIKGNLQSIDDKRVRLQGALNLESKQNRDAKLSMDGDAEINIRNGFKGDIKLNWTPMKSSTSNKLQANIDLSDKIVKGPHSIVIVGEKAEFKFNHELAAARGKGTLKTSFSAKDKRGEKLMEANVEGDYNELNGKSVQLKTTVDSVRYPSININHLFTLTVKPSEWQLISKLNHNDAYNRITLKRQTTASMNTNSLTIDGHLHDGSSAKFTAESECSNKCAFNAKLMRNDQEHSKLNVQIPLVKLTEFITQRASVRFESPVFGTEAAFEIDAPATNKILVRAHANVNSQQLAGYRLQISDGASFKPYGDDVQLSGDSILFEQELKWKSVPIAEQKILVSQNALAANLMVGQWKTMNTMIAGNRALGQSCWTSYNLCGDYKITLEERTANGAKYDWVARMKEGSEELYKLHAKVDYDLTPENEQLNVVSTVKDRKYGFGLERVSSSSGKRLWKIKSVLPKRSPEVHFEYQPMQGNQLVGKVIVFHDIQKESEKMIGNFNINWENTPTRYVINQVYSMSHNSIAEPFTVEAKIALDKARRSERSVLGYKSFDYHGKVSHGSNLFLVGEANWEIKADEISKKFNVYNQDKKINFGCVSNTKKTDAPRSLLAKRNVKCHWTNRDGQVKTLERDYNFDGQILRDGPKISFSESVIQPLMAYKISGKFHAADLLNLASLHLTIPDGPSYDVKVSIKENCLYLNTESVDDPKKYQLESCLNKRPRADEPYFTFNLTDKSTSESLVSFKFSRMADFAHDKRVTLKWNPIVVSDAVISAIQEYEEQARKQKAAFIEAKQEMSDKVGIVRNAFGEKLVQPFTTYWSQEIQRFAREMEPEYELIKGILPVKSEKKYRFTRSIDLYDAQSYATVHSPITYQWVVKDLDGGELELIVRNVEPEYYPHDIATAVYRLWREMQAY